MCAPGVVNGLVVCRGFGLKRDALPENVNDSGRMPIPKDVRPRRPENVKRTSNVDMMLRTSTVGGEHDRDVSVL